MRFLACKQHPKGYEVSSKGDSRFSAFYAILPDGRSIEQHYQCDVKGYDPGGINWKLGKGKPPLDQSKDLATEYLLLWRTWAYHHPEMLEDLRKLAVGRVLTDMFATSQINQANALAFLLNHGVM